MTRPFAVVSLSDVQSLPAVYPSLSSAAQTATCHMIITQLINKYVCTIDQELRNHLPDGSTFLREMTSLPPSWMCEVKLKIRLCQLINIILKNIPAKYHLDPIWNDEALVFLKTLPQQKEEEKQQQ